MSMLFLATILILSCSTQSHAVEYTVTNNAGNTPGGVRFTKEIEIQYSQQTMTKSTDFIWRTFQQNNPRDRKGRCPSELVHPTTWTAWRTRATMRST
ncbi:hypothetical protein NL676_038834 [Syzygium grande]|nr:hypothetical protein NL676_038834 [Syzygium grande]